MTAAMAPDAPTSGIVLSGWETTCATVAATPPAR